MTKPLAFPGLAQLMAAMAGRNMTAAGYVAVTAGISNGSKTQIVKGLNEGQQVILQ